MNLPSIWCLAAVVLSGLAAFAQDSTTTQKGIDKVFVGYVFRPPTNINFKLYTHLCHAFVTADASGVVRTNRNVPSRGLVSAAHRAGVKVILSLGGWGWDQQFAAIVRSPEAEDRYAASVLNIVDAFDYDGIDLDWEYPDTTEEVAGFAHLSKRFRKQLDALALKKQRPMLQTMAAAASTNTLEWLSNELLLETMDWVNVMTYDMAGEWTDYAGHHSPLFASSKQPGAPRSTALSIKYLLDRGMPPSRLALGIPLYGKGFFASEPYASTKDKKGPSTGSGRGPGRPPGGHYSRLLQLEKEQGWVRQWDNETKTPWLISPDRSAVIGYDDPESVALKTEWAMKQGLRGVFFWEIANDRMSDGTNPLQESARRKLD